MGVGVDGTVGTTGTVTTGWMGPAGPTDKRLGRITQLTMSPQTDGINVHQIAAQVTFPDALGNITISMGDALLPKPLLLNQRVEVLLALRVTTP